jgi:hypothetical protein
VAAAQLDSRTVEGIDLEVLNGIIKKHGADSDEAKVEVYGSFRARATGSSSAAT